MKIGTFINQKENMSKENVVSKKQVVGKNKKAGNFSFKKEKVERAKKEKADE